MSKPALGRGLGQLLIKPAVPAGDSAAAHDAVNNADIGPGMVALLRAGPAPAVLPPQDRTVGPLRWSLAIADILLCVLASMLVLNYSGKLSFPGALVCVLAVGGGAWLGCLAFFLEPQRIKS